MEKTSPAGNDPTPFGGEVEAKKPALRKRLRPGTVIGMFLVAGIATNLLFARLEDEPYFPDETALLGQSYYFELYRGNAPPGGGSAWNHVDWIRYPAYDHPPLVKYLVALALKIGGKPVPQDTSRIMAWYGGDWSEPDRSTLYWLRVPIVACGVMACLMVYFIGVRIRSRFVGLSAACLVAFSPLFYTLSRRALFDVPAEAFVLASVALMLWVWPRLVSSGTHLGTWVWFILAGGLLGACAMLSKLNGALALALLAANLFLAVSVAVLQRWTGNLGKGVANEGDNPRQTHAASRNPPSAIAISNLVLAPGALAGVFVVALLAMLLLNPYLTATPPLGALPSGEYQTREVRDLGLLARLRYLFRFRFDWSRQALEDEQFQSHWLPDFSSRVRAVFWEGFGRYSPFGKRRPDWYAGMRDPATGEELEHLLPRTWGALIWFPLCAVGFLWLLRDGGSELASGRPPLHWGVALYMAVVVAAVTVTVPLAWDRYFLPLVPAGCLAAVYGVVRSIAWLGSRFVLEPPKPGG